MFFVYGEKELSYLRDRDKRLGNAIDRIGHIERAVDSDLFSSVVHHIVGQQISTAAQATLWKRLRERLGSVTADAILALGREELQAVGMTFRKADYILDFAGRVQSGAFDIAGLDGLTDAEVIRELSALKGVGVWTAEMIMIFCMQRPDVVSFGDLAIHRGMRMLYRHKKIDRAKFERCRRRYSPYGTVASLYLWAVAGGALPELTDPMPRKVTK